MSFLSGGSSQERMPDYMPGQSPQEQAARKQADAMLFEQKRMTDSAIAETERLKGIEAGVAAKAETEKKDEEQRRQQRLVGGGIQRFLTAGYAGYGDSRPLGTGLTLGG
jgi:hypothetical protein